MAKETVFEDPTRGHVALLCYDEANDRYRVLEVEGDDHPGLRVSLYDGDNNARVLAPSGDNRSPNYPSLLVLGQLYGFDGTNWDRLRCTDQKLDVVAHGWDGSQARKLPLLWGYSDDLDIEWGGTVVGTTWEKLSTAVPAGQVHVVQGVSIRCASRAMGLTFVYIIKASGTQLALYYAATVGQLVPALVLGTFTLVEGDAIGLYVGSLLAGDVMLGGVIGYKMQVDQ